MAASRTSDLDRLMIPPRWDVALCQPKEPAGPGCQPTVLSRTIYAARHVYVRTDYRGACFGCGQLGPIRPDENEAAEDAHDHTHPGWRDLPVLDPLLLHELVMGTEHPQVLRGAFDREFLALPGPVLVTVMQHHQKYFAVEDGRRQLLPYFLAVRDGDDRHLATVRQGHEWVLRARLADARFFFQEDHRRRLEDYLPRLDGLLLQAQLGTMAEKTRRLVTLSRHVSGLLLLDGRSTEALLRAATLSKADLVTKMVGEFPELQGVIGQIYAELDGEPPEVARATRWWA